MILREITTWTYSEKEIRELQPEFEAVFNTKLMKMIGNGYGMENSQRTRLT